MNLIASENGKSEEYRDIADNHDDKTDNLDDKTQWEST